MILYKTVKQQGKTVIKPLRRGDLKTSETELIFRKFDDLENCHFSDHKGDLLTCILYDDNFEAVKKRFLNVLRGSIVKVMISASKNRDYKKRIITSVLGIEPPIQTDIEQFINLN